MPSSSSPFLPEHGSLNLLSAKEKRVNTRNRQQEEKQLEKRSHFICFNLYSTVSLLLALALFALAMVIVIIITIST
jgi:hypothetical protein